MSGPPELDFRLVDEPEAGPKWQALFEEFWPPYREWFLREGNAARPTYARTRRALREAMPELEPTWETLCDLAGGSDQAARFLGLYCPTPFLTGCSQALWPGEGGPALVRNYDYAPDLCDGVILRSAWNGRTVVAFVDCLWGVLDGINEDGLAVALAFGGRKAVGEGFAITLILRYVLETCATVAEARSALARLTPHMVYTVVALDATGAHLTAWLSPDRPPRFERRACSTNHQGRVEWPAYARFSATERRERRLGELLEGGADTLEDLTDAFLAPPLYRTAWTGGHGTLYTSLYRPRERSLEVRWPDRVRHLGVEGFEEEVFVVRYGPEAGKAILGP